MFLAGDFFDQQAATRALRDLKANGFTPAEIAVFSDEPIEFPRGVLHRPSHMSFAVVSGAITACLLTIAFIYLTQHNYPVVTGGMPIFSGWATGVIFYELTLLGAILTTFVWFLRESGLLRRGKRPPGPAIEPGIISVRVECGTDRAGEVRHSLESAGGVNIRPLESGK